MQLNTILKVDLTAATATAFALLFFNAMPSMAFDFVAPRDLKKGEDIVDSSIWELENRWDLSGTLKGSDKFIQTKSLSLLTYGTIEGSRTFLSTPTSYEQKFDGTYSSALPTISWPGNNDLYSDSKGKITPEWGQFPGWKTRDGANAKFSQVWNLEKTVLDPGYLNCPWTFDGKRVINCRVVETWWGGALDIKAQAFLEGSIANSIIGDETISLLLQLDRVLDYQVIGKSSLSDRIASINGGIYELKLKDSGGLGDINIKFNVREE